MASRLMARIAALTGALVVAGVVAPVVPAVAVTGPTVQIVSPAVGGSVHGKTTVTVTGTVDPTQADSPDWIHLYLDGNLLAAGVCATDDTDPDPGVCTITFPWDSSGLNGSHTLRATFNTTGNHWVTTDRQAVIGANPPPTVTIVSPAGGTLVRGKVLVKVTATTDPNQNDRPGYISAYFGGGPWSWPGDCSTDDLDPDPNVCTLIVSVDSTTHAGAWGLHAELRTTHEVVVESAPVVVLVHTGTRTYLLRPSTVTSGKPFTIRGVVYPQAGHPSAVAGMKVRVTYRPLGVAARVVLATVNAKGYFSAKFTAGDGGRVTATTSATTLLGSSETSIGILGTARIVCKMGPTVRHGVADQGKCTIAHLPAGTKAALQSKTGGWHDLITGSSPAGGVLGFAVYWPHPGTFYLRMVIAKNSVFVQTFGPPIKIVVT